MKNLLLAEDLSVVDDRICPPPTVRPADLGDLLSTVAERLESDGVLMLSGPWADYVTPYQEQGGSQDASATLDAGDWAARVVVGDTWIRWTNPDGHAIWTCEIDAIEPRGKDSPLIEANQIATAMNFALWRQATDTGVGWVGTPGMTGNALLVDGWGAMNPKAKTPMWSKCGIWYPLESKPTWPFGAIETAYTPRQWERDYDGPTHGYDLNKAYLSAYQVAELHVDQLTHHTAGDGFVFDPKLGAVWRVELSPWRYGSVLPDPAGYAPELDDGSRWVTTPTLVLLQQLTDRGDYDGFTVREFWGLGNPRRVTRKWAELINDMATAGRDPIATAAKQVYKQTYGMWARGGRVHRPDWHYTIIAQNRVNLWRKMDTAYRGASATLEGRSCHQQAPANYAAPIRVETDCVFYPGADDGHPDNWADTAPYGFKLDPSGIKLGHFKPYMPKGER